MRPGHGDVGALAEIVHAVSIVRNNGRASFVFLCGEHVAGGFPAVGDSVGGAGDCFHKTIAFWLVTVCERVGAIGDGAEASCGIVGVARLGFDSGTVLSVTK